jgi:hypothetical protein
VLTLSANDEDLVYFGPFCMGGLSCMQKYAQRKGLVLWFYALLAAAEDFPGNSFFICTKTSEQCDCFQCFVKIMSFWVVVLITVGDIFTPVSYVNIIVTRGIHCYIIFNFHKLA